MINFGAGPAKLPTEVIRNASDAMFSLGESPGILEMSHRSPQFKNIINSAEAELRRFYNLGSREDGYSIIFMQGGGTLQFSAVTLNLILSLPGSYCALYLVSGSWSRKAYNEAKLLTEGTNHKVFSCDLDSANQETLEKLCQVENQHRSRSEKANAVEKNKIAYIYHCDNETIEGVETPDADAVPNRFQKNYIHVADMSSNFMTRPVNIKRYGLIFATAQKNFGTTGVTIVIVKNNLLNRQSTYKIPLIMDYKVMASHESLYNTPPTFSIMVVELVLKWMKLKNENLESWDIFTRRKSNLIYEVIERNSWLYSGMVPVNRRSRVNVTFHIHQNGVTSHELEEFFIKKAKDDLSIIQIKGHRSIGGIRVSLYNAVDEDEALVMAKFMNEFASLQKKDNFIFKQHQNHSVDGEEENEGSIRD